MAVLEFHGVGIEQQRLLLLTDYVRSGVVEGIGNQKIDREEVMVMTRENMMDMFQRHLVCNARPAGLSESWGVQGRQRI